MDRSRRERAHEELGRQILEEKLGALRRITETLERHVAELHALRDAARGLTGAERQRAEAAFRERRALAERWLWYLRVQREVLGFRDGRTLDEMFPIPDFRTPG